MTCFTWLVKCCLFMPDNECMNDITSGVFVAGRIQQHIPWGVKKSPVQQQSQRGYAGHQLRFHALCCRMIWRTAIPFVPACTFQSDQKFAAFDVLTLSLLWINNLPLNHMVSSLCREGTGSVATPTCGFNYGLWRGESARQKQTYGSRTTDPRCFPFLCRDERTARRNVEETKRDLTPNVCCMLFRIVIGF